MKNMRLLLFTLILIAQNSCKDKSFTFDDSIYLTQQIKKNINCDKFNYKEHAQRPLHIFMCDGELISCYIKKDTVDFIGENNPSFLKLELCKEFTYKLKELNIKQIQIENDSTRIELLINSTNYLLSNYLVGSKGIKHNQLWFYQIQN